MVRQLLSIVYEDQPIEFDIGFDSNMAIQNALTCTGVLFISQDSHERTSGEDEQTQSGKYAHGVKDRH